MAISSRLQLLIHICESKIMNVKRIYWQHAQTESTSYMDKNVITLIEKSAGIIIVQCLIKL